MTFMKISFRTLVAFVITGGVAVGVSAQSVYPGQHSGKLKVADTAPAKVKAFDLKEVRLLPGRVHDNLLPLYDANRMRYCVYWNLEK